MMETMTRTLSLSIQSRLELIEQISSMTRSATDALAFDEATADRIDLAVREAVANAIQHGHQGRADKTVDVEWRVSPGRLEILVRDHGEGFDSSTLADPRQPENLLKPTSRGVFLMRAFMDEVEYSAHPLGGTLVRMVKRKTQSSNTRRGR